MNKKELAKAVNDLSSPSRRKRQEAAHAIAESMLEKPQNILSFTDDIFDALERPEAQTRWELLNSLTLIVEGNTRVLAPAVHFAEPSLFDEDSSTVRLASFRFITAVGSQTKALSKKVWPMLEESIQVYHGDPQYREMLMAITDFVAAPIDPDIKKAVVARIKFDAKNSTLPIIKHLANDVLKAARGQKPQQKKSTAEKKASSKGTSTAKQRPTKAATQAAATKKTGSKAATANKAGTKATTANKAGTKKAITKKATPKKSGATKKTTTAKKAAATKNTTAKKPATTKKPTTAKKAAATKKTAAKKATAKKPTIVKKAATAKKASAKKAAATKKPTVAKKAATKKSATAKKPVSKKAKGKIAESKAAKALKKLTSKKSR